MRSLSACILFFIIALMVGCAAPEKPVYHDVTFDYDVKVDFDQIKSYNWVTMPATSRLSEFNQIRIRKAVDTKLSTLGMSVKIDSPDVYLVMFGGTLKGVDMTVMLDYAVYDIGRLKLAMYDAESHQEIWWAESRADLFHEMTPAQKDEVIDVSVRNILVHYPPRP